LVRIGFKIWEKKNKIMINRPISSIYRSVSLPRHGMSTEDEIGITNPTTAAATASPFSRVSAELGVFGSPTRLRSSHANVSGKGIGLGAEERERGKMKGHLGAFSDLTDKKRERAR
jgi:hypothetical protein